LLLGASRPDPVQYTQRLLMPLKIMMENKLRASRE
jgi:hypothetical protein